MADPYEKEARRLAGLIGSLVKLAGRSVEEVAERAGLNPEDLAGIFRGEARLEVAHLLRLGEALGMHPGEFLYLAYPRRMPARGSTRDLLAKARAATFAHNLLPGCGDLRGTAPGNSRSHAGVPKTRAPRL